MSEGPMITLYDGHPSLGPKEDAPKPPKKRGRKPGTKNRKNPKDRHPYLKGWLGTMKAILATQGCIGCGDTDPSNLTFRHRSGEEKLFPIGKGPLMKGMTLEMLRKEVQKCIIRDHEGRVEPSLVCRKCSHGVLANQDRPLLGRTEIPRYPDTQETLCYTPEVQGAPGSPTSAPLHESPKDPSITEPMETVDPLVKAIWDDDGPRATVEGATSYNNSPLVRFDLGRMYDEWVPHEMESSEAFVLTVGERSFKCQRIN